MSASETGSSFGGGGRRAAKREMLVELCRGGVLSEEDARKKLRRACAQCGGSVFVGRKAEKTIMDDGG